MSPTAPHVLCVYILASPTRFAAAAERFWGSYRRHPAGAEHDLLVVQKGSNPYPGPPATIVNRPEEGFDIGPFQAVCVENEDYNLVMLLSATGELRTDDWLAHYLAAFEDPNVSAVSATGSFEKGYSVRNYNPHLRTANFMVRPCHLNALELPQAVSKMDCWHIEHGERNLTLALEAQGYRCLVVGRNGLTYDWHHWPQSQTFWTGEQENLIASDAQTDRYADGDSELRAFLSYSAWRVLPDLPADEVDAFVRRYA